MDRQTASRDGVSVIRGSAVRDDHQAAQNALSQSLLRVIAEFIKPTML